MTDPSNNLPGAPSQKVPRGAEPKPHPSADAKAWARRALELLRMNQSPHSIRVARAALELLRSPPPDDPAAILARELPIPLAEARHRLEVLGHSPDRIRIDVGLETAGLTRA